jgi:hypothetical protein
MTLEACCMRRQSCARRTPELSGRLISERAHSAHGFRSGFSTIMPTARIAVVRTMECREWVDKEYRGLYTFTFETEQELLSVAYKSEKKYSLFGQKIEKLILIWQKDLNAVFYGIAADDWAGPVQMLSLHFGDVQMFPYALGSTMEEATLVNKIERRCRRLD